MTEEKVSIHGNSSYKEVYNEQAKKLCLLGATDERLANFFEVAESTINKWKLDYPAFSESIKEGKEVADANVAAALYNRAIGYSHPHDHISNHQGDITVTPTTKHYAPDTAAAFIWLKNRGGWKDKQEVEHSGDAVTFNMNFSGNKESK